MASMNPDSIMNLIMVPSKERSRSNSKNRDKSPKNLVSSSPQRPTTLKPARGPLQERNIYDDHNENHRNRASSQHMPSSQSDHNLRYGVGGYSVNNNDSSAYRNSYRSNNNEGGPVHLTRADEQRVSSRQQGPRKKVKKKNSLRRKLTKTIAAVANVNIPPHPTTTSGTSGGHGGKDGAMYRVKKSASGGIATVRSEPGSPESDEDLSCYEFSMVTDDRQPIEGQLYKYTNVVKGYQFRWFVLDPETGRLDYYEKEEHKKQKARGYIHLAGAVISPSDEDSQTFNVNASNGDIYRLRASDARERQVWVNRLRATSEYHTDLLLKNPRDGRMTSGYSGSLDSLNKSNENLRKLATNSFKSGQNPASLSSPRKNSPVIIKKSLRKNSPVISRNRSHRKSLTGSHSNLSTTQFREVKDMLTQVSHQVQTLRYKIEDLPFGESPHSTDREMLLLKATSTATLGCLDNCLSILQQQNISPMGHYPPVNGAVIRSPAQGIKPYVESVASAESYVTVSTTQVPAESTSDPALNHDDEIEDPSTYHDTDLESIEEHKPVILHLLSQLKLGMDLTKVVLPTFILEKRSLLEMFADCMAHPDLFLRITDEETPEKRMIAMLEWYLTSFHAGRQGCLAKKPYNPIIGETFHCSWKARRSPSTADSNHDDPGIQIDPAANGTDSDRQMEAGEQNLQSRLGGDDVNTEAEGSINCSGRNLYYTAEQVSHHPPISSFYFESPEAKMFMNGSIYTKSKFLGMSIGVTMIGKVQLHLLEHDEVYEFSLPSAYARSILTVPWVEMGDKVSLACPSTGYSASVIFHTKPFYGGRLHKVTSEVKSPSSEVICKVQGEWNKALEFTFLNGETKTIHLASLPVHRKCVRPISHQGEMESRRLWQAVTMALYRNDIDSATEHKRFLEERQRQGEKHRRENNTAFNTRFFHQEGDGWIFNSCLQ